MTSLNHTSDDSDDATWCIVRYGWWPLSVFMYIACLPAIAANTVASIIFAFRGDGDAWIVIGGCLAMVAITPLMALLIRRVMYWEISKTGVRYVNFICVTALTWSRIECLRRLPFALYLAGPNETTFIPKRILLAPWLMESSSEFRRLISDLAPPGHVLREHTSIPIAEKNANY